MEREQRDFDAKTNQQSSHEQELGFQSQFTAEDWPQAEIHCLFNSVNNLDVTTGASQDLKQADNLARQYIELFGIDSSNNVELPKTIQNPNSPYLTLSESTKTDIDNHVSYLINYALNSAINIIDYNIDEFNKLASDLLIKKSVNLNYLSSLNVSYY